MLGGRFKIIIYLVIMFRFCTPLVNCPVLDPAWEVSISINMNVCFIKISGMTTRTDLYLLRNPQGGR